MRLTPNNEPLGLGAGLAVAAMVVLGMVGGALIVAHSGYTTSPKRGGTRIHVPAPEAYVLAAALFGMSFIGLIVLLRAQAVSRWVMAFAMGSYGVIGWLLIRWLAPG